VVNRVSSCLSFLPERLHFCSYIFTDPTCTTIIITLEFCVLNAEFQHFILRFNQISLFCEYITKRGDKGGKEARRQGDLRITLML
jgi:hypothetical protein